MPLQPKQLGSACCRPCPLRTLPDCGPAEGQALAVSWCAQAGRAGCFQHAVQWRLGAQTTEAGRTCQVQRVGSGGHCGAALDTAGHHAAVCKFGGFKTTRHSWLVQCLRTVLREAGATVAPREVEVPGWQRADGTRARLDVRCAWAGRPHYIDVTLRHPCAIKYVAQAALGDGAAARAAEAAKRDRYPVLAAAGLDAAIPFALETFGRLGLAGLRLLRQARQSAAEQSRPYRTWAGGPALQKWLSQLSCSLQWSLYESARACWGAAGPLPPDPAGLSAVARSGA